jgi:uncharacterized membrane protein YcaP (DUF421 family)
MDLVFRAIVLYFFIYVLMRVVGRRELSGIEPFDLILLIVIGDAVQQGLTQDDYTVTGAILVVATIAGLQVGMSYLGFKIPRLRPMLEGEPIVLIQDGRPVTRNLSRERLALEEVLEEARSSQIGTLDEIAWAVLESSGNISFIKKSG